MIDLIYTFPGLRQRGADRYSVAGGGEGFGDAGGLVGEDGAVGAGEEPCCGIAVFRFYGFAVSQCCGGGRGAARNTEMPKYRNTRHFRVHHITISLHLHIATSLLSDDG